ncbi:MAG: archaeosortase/exosortase family protein [Verrucomicrobia bacterium]|nr:archaeosortase/exosortase family protein [Verrucomicrobiota bacterium]
MSLIETIRHALKTRRWEFVFELVFIACVGFAFWPLTQWLFDKSFGHEQFLHSLLVILVAAYFILFRGKGRTKWVLKIDLSTITLFGGSLVLLLVGSVVLPQILVPLALSLAMTAGASYLLGKVALKRGYPFFVVFYLYMVLIVFYPVLDFPLREYAARYSAWILDVLHLGPEILLRTQPEPSLILLVQGRTFVVEPECNGFGLISASLLLSILLTFKSRDFWWTKSLGIISALFLGSLGNLLRIVTIIILAPLVPNHYDFMHETVGLLAFFFVLLLIGWLLWKRPALPVNA